MKVEVVMHEPGAFIRSWSNVLGPWRTGDEFAGGRYCNEHGWHGVLYDCPSYPPALRQAIGAMDGAFVAAVSEPDWGEELEPNVRAIVRVLAGVKP